MFFFQNCGGKFEGISDLSSTDPNFLAESVRAPQINITESPMSLTNIATANFRFSVTTNRYATLTNLTCSLDGAAAVNCMAGFSAAALSDGDHQLLVNATDSRGNNSLERLFTWRVDTAAPVILVTAQPANPSALDMARFEFSVTDSLAGVAAVECSYNDAAFAACTSPVVFNDLVNGSYNFRIRARDNIDNMSAIVSHTWVVNIVVGAPTVAVALNVRTATVTFSSTNAVTYQCRLDSGATESCTSPKVYTNVADGIHTVTVTGIRSGVMTSANAMFTIDLAPPSLPVITADISDMTNRTSANFSFSSSDSLSGLNRFECRMDAAAFATCTSPQNVALTAGAHTFSVRAVDNANNISAIAQFLFTVDLVAPVITLTRSPALTTTDTNAVFDFTVTDSATITSITCRLDAAAFTACSNTRSYTALPLGTRNFQVRAVDRAGNEALRTHTWTIAAGTPTPTPTPTPINNIAEVSWDINTESSVTGYLISYGTASNTYTTTVDARMPAAVGGRMSYIISGLTSGRTYYFAVKAYSASEQSAFSNEASKVLP